MYDEDLIQVTLFEEIGLEKDPLYISISSIHLNETKVISISGTLYHITYKTLSATQQVYEYESEQQHGIAKGINDLLVKLNAD